MNRQPQNRGGEQRAPQNARQSSMQQGARPASARPTPPPPRQKRALRNAGSLQLLQMIMMVVIVAVLIIGILLLTLPMFRVSEVVVEGVGFTTEELKEIKRAAEIEEGTEIWSVRAGHKSREIDGRIYDACPYVKTISISCGFSKVTITVTKIENPMYTEHGGEWYVFDTDLQVWMKNAEESAFSPFLKVKLPALSSASVGQKLGFSNTNISYGYIAELVEGLKRAEVLEHVTYIDFSNKFGLSCVIEDTCRMELGDVSSLDRKLERFSLVLAEKNSSSYAVIDVSDPTKATYRTIDAAELYQ